MDDIAIATERRNEAPCTPLEAIGRLRAHTPDRGHFLLESLEPDDAGRRYSIVGYRVRRGEMIPPWSDWLEAFGEHEAEPEAEGATEAERLAAGMARAYVGAFTANSPLMRLEIPVSKDAGASMIMAGATVLVFDHADGSMTAAGPAKGNLVPRILYELEHGQTPAPLPPSDLETLAGLQLVPDADKLAARCKRAVGMLDEDDLPELTLCRTWTAPRAGIDPFDVYRAWREDTDAPAGYYLDFGRTPMQGAVQVLGFGRIPLHLRRPGVVGRAWKEAFAEALPHPSCTGSRDPLALRVIAKLEDQSRELFGGAIGYLAPGGVASGLLADDVLHVIDDFCVFSAGVALALDADPRAAIAASEARIAPALAAYARAARVEPGTTS